MAIRKGRISVASATDPPLVWCGASRTLPAIAEGSVPRLLASLGDVADLGPTAPPAVAAAGAGRLVRRRAGRRAGRVHQDRPRRRAAAPRPRPPGAGQP